MTLREMLSDIHALEEEMLAFERKYGASRRRMSNPLRTAEDYELFLYTLPDRFASIRRCTLTFVRRGAFLARVAGEIYFDHGIRLNVRQRIVYDRLPAVIDSYVYEVWRAKRSCTGMTLSRTQATRICRARILITSIFLRTSSVTAYLRARWWPTSA
jgi:hypothetical protein